MEAYHNYRVKAKAAGLGHDHSHGYGHGHAHAGHRGFFSLLHKHLQEVHEK
jgi:hypothetical protein